MSSILSVILENIEKKVSIYYSIRFLAYDFNELNSAMYVFPLARVLFPIIP